MRHCSKPEHIDLLLKKGVYPYDHMSDWSKMDETELPSKRLAWMQRQAQFQNPRDRVDVSDGRRA